MNGSGCCSAEPKRRRARGRAGEAAGWVTSAAMLAVMPKCPLCLAGYVALATGIGMTAATAWYVRTGLLVLCATSLALLALRLVRRLAVK